MAHAKPSEEMPWAEMRAGLPIPLGPASLGERFGAVLGANGRRPRAGENDDDVTGTTARLLDLLETLDVQEAVLARGCLPRCDSTFGAGLALFLSVTALGCREWLGPKAAAQLAALDDGLVLDECDQALMARFQSIDGRAWRILRVPLLDTVAAHRAGSGLLCATSLDEELATAFTVVLQAWPPALGAVQLMATIAGQRLDVTLRAATGLPAPLLAELYESFHAVLSACGLDGGLTVGPLVGAWLGLDDELSSDIAL